MLLGLKVEAMVRAFGRGLAGAVGGDWGVGGGWFRLWRREGGEGSGVRVRREGCGFGAGFRGVGGAEGESRVRVVAVVSEAATTMPKASPLSQLQSASRVWFLRAAPMSQEAMSGFWPLGGRSMRWRIGAFEPDGHGFPARGHAGDAEADAGEPGRRREETQERHAVAHQSGVSPSRAC